jgi:dimethylaniline monooxygenase (N-oxide forming)
MQTIGVVGAGISGLVAAKTFLEEGFGVTVFEKEDEVGGVWARSRRYPGLTTQNPRDTYAFSDFPMPRHYPDWPRGEQVQAYLAAYADRFGVTPHLRLSTRVDSVAPRADGAPGWMVRATRLDGGGAAAGEETHHFDFVAVCNGVFSEPFVPDVPGMAEFTAAGGTALHSTRFHDAQSVEGKRLVVVGFAKSACDVAVAATKGARETTLVYRRAMWKVPKRFFGVVPLKYVLTTRVSESLFRYRTLRGAERFLHTAGAPLLWLFWRNVERSLRARQKLDACELVPEEPLERLVGCSVSLETDGFYAAVRDGEIRPRRGEVRRMEPGAVELSTGERVEADVVVFGTGFRQDAPFLDASVRGRIVDEEGIFHLHRNLVHPEAPRLGFVGYNSSLYSQLTSEIGARWLARFFKGEVRLPPADEVRREDAARLAWLRAERPNGLASGTCITPFNFHYLAELLGDLGARTWRTRNRLKELMMPVDPSIYANLKAELDARPRASPPREPALGAKAKASID